MSERIDTGDWGHSTYEAFLDIDGDYSMFKEKATGAFAVCITAKKELVLSNNEPLGGHIESDETPMDTIKREALEEGGFEITEAKYYGYYLIKRSSTASGEFKTRYPTEALLIFFIARGNIVSKPTDKNAGVRAIIPISKLTEHSDIKHRMLFEGIRLLA